MDFSFRGLGEYEKFRGYKFYRILTILQTVSAKIIEEMNSAFLQTFKVVDFSKIVKSLKMVTTITKRSILDVLHVREPALKRLLKFRQ